MISLLTKSMIEVEPLRDWFQLHKMQETQLLLELTLLVNQNLAPRNLKNLLNQFWKVLTKKYPKKGLPHKILTWWQVLAHSELLTIIVSIIWVCNKAQFTWEGTLKVSLYTLWTTHIPWITRLRIVLKIKDLQWIQALS